MTTPIVTEITPRPVPTERDTFVVQGPFTATWPPPKRRPLDV